nr:hypothetical protein Iba_chr04bCG14700 [Ipomoea batatas]
MENGSELQAYMMPAANLVAPLQFDDELRRWEDSAMAGGLLASRRGDTAEDEDDFPSPEDCRSSVCRIAGGGAGFQAARGGDTKCGLGRLGVETGFTLFSLLLFDERRWFMVGCGVVSRFRSECFMDEHTRQ